MTLVAQLDFSCRPMLVGDTLISSASAKGVGMRLPTIGTIHEIRFPDERKLPDTVRQKVHVIGDNLAVAWSGHAIKAKAVISQLRERNRKIPFANASDVFDFLSSSVNKDIWEDEDNPVAFAGYVAQPRDQDFAISKFVAKTRGTPSKKVLVPHLGEALLLGLGTDVAERTLNALTWDSFIKAAKSSFPTIDVGLVAGLALTSALLAKELVTKETLVAGCGGAFELAIFDNGAFRKLEMAHLIWDYRYDGRTSEAPEVRRFGLRPRRLVKTSYVDDLLLVVYAGFKNESGSMDDLKLDDVGCHAITPIDCTTVSANQSALMQSNSEKTWKLNPRYQVNTFAIRIQDQIAYVPHVSIGQDYHLIDFALAEDGRFWLGVRTALIERLKTVTSVCEEMERGSHGPARGNAVG